MVVPATVCFCQPGLGAPPSPGGCCTGGCDSLPFRLRRENSIRKSSGRVIGVICNETWLTGGNMADRGVTQKGSKRERTAH